MKVGKKICTINYSGYLEHMNELMAKIGNSYSKRHK